jgi:hypothetical protein
MNTATWKISLWIENDQGLYNGARECADGDSLEEWFLGLCEPSNGFAMDILLDLLGSVDWNDIYERVTAE